MTRAKFLKMMFLGSAATATSTIPLHRQNPEKLIHLYSGPINGTQFYDAMKVIDQIRHNDLLRLKMQPNNKHDHRAIEVFWGEHKLGYVPRVDNTILYNLMKNEAALVVRIKTNNPHKHHNFSDLNTMLRMRIWMIEGESVKRA